MILVNYLTPTRPPETSVDILVKSLRQKESAHGVLNAVTPMVLEAFEVGYLSLWQILLLNFTDCSSIDTWLLGAQC